MKNIDDIGVRIPQVYLPKKGTDLKKWAVIACDQYTSQPDYWKKVEKLVGVRPSTLNMILPEVYLDKPGEEQRVYHIHKSMGEYLKEGILEYHEGFIYLERIIKGRKRSGLMLCLDLEHYDYTRGSTSLIRATEGTIIERLPPRMKIRIGAPLELPHIIVLIDDPEKTVIEPLGAIKDKFTKLYDVQLMFDSGHLTGYAVSPEKEEQIFKSLSALASPDHFSKKYGLPPGAPVLLFAMGDGNHSLATAKAVWERIKPEVGLNHPARYALVEIENVHDEALVFEPIHRILVGLRKDIIASMKQFYGAINLIPVPSSEMMIRRVNEQSGPTQLLGMVGGGEGRSYTIIEITKPLSNLPVGTLQAFLDVFKVENGADTIDYIHGEDVVCSLGRQDGNAGFYVSGMQKSDLFKTVILDGALPRKTFSMGKANEKRFYMEARKIIQY